MYSIGRINLEIYKCITEDITTDEVIITSERIKHIEECHAGAFEKISDYMQLALNDPDYILEDNKNPKTGLVLKRIKDENLRFQLVLRVHTSTDDNSFKNSIISGWDISESRWKNYVSNRKILYKKEK